MRTRRVIQALVAVLVVPTGATVLVLTTAVFVMGMIVPGVAADERSVGSSEQRHLTVNGRPLSRLLNPTIPARGGVDSHLARPTPSPVSGILTLRTAAAGRVAQASAPTRSQQATTPNRSWIKRHPVLFGAIVGAVGGAAIVGAIVDAEASPVGFYGGGAAGAVVGWFVGP